MFSSRFIGFKNYLDLFRIDPLFWQSLKVTGIYTLIGVPLRLALALAIALLLNQKIKALALFRTIYYLPTVVSGVAVAVLWSWVFNGEFGILNYVLSKFGIQGPMWLADINWALPALIIMSLWGIGAPMIIFLAALQGVPTQLYEAAQLDGANTFQKFLKITIPLISPVIFFNLIINIIASFQVFTQAYIMTEGGPAHATLLYVFYLFKNGFEEFHMGYASAMAWILFFIILAFTLLIFKSSSTWVHYEEG